MWKNIVVALALLVACHEPETDKYMDEFFSDALPFQFWKNGELTYNDKNECYRLPHKYYHKVDCSKETRLRFRDKIESHQLRFLNCGDTVLASLPFTTVKELYSMPALGSWINSGGGSSWTLGDNPTVSVPNAQPISKHLVGKLKSYDVGTYRFNWQITVTGTDLDGQVEMGIYNYGGALQMDFEVIKVITGAGTFSGSVELTATEIPYQLSIRVHNESSSEASVINVVVDSVVQTTVKNYVHSISFIPSDSDLCGKLARLRIYPGDKQLPGLSEWGVYNEGTEGWKSDWALGSTPSIPYVVDEPAPSYWGLTSPVSTVGTGAITVHWKLNISHSLTGSGLGMVLGFYKAGVLVATGSGATPYMDTAGDHEGTITLDIDEIPDEVRAVFSNFDIASFVLTVLDLSTVVPDLDVESYTFQTDLLDFTTSMGCGQEILYKSSKDAFSIPYDVGSPYFSIFIPAQFSIPNYPTTQKEIQLTNRYVEAAFSMKEQRLFQLVDEGLPGYMHKKIKSIFAHGVPGIVLIDGKAWIMSEEYQEIKDRPDKFKPYIGKVWLTRKNYITTTAI